MFSNVISYKMAKVEGYREQCYTVVPAIFYQYAAQRVVRSSVLITHAYLDAARVLSCACRITSTTMGLRPESPYINCWNYRVFFLHCAVATLYI